MPNYLFKCPECNNHYEKFYDFDAEQKLICACGAKCNKDYSSVQIQKAESFYSPGLGKEVQFQNQYKRELKQMSEEATERTGLVHDFQPMDMSDKESLGVTDAGLDETHDRKVATGEKEKKLYL